MATDRSVDPGPVRLALSVARALRRINTGVALVCGLALVAAVVMVLLEILLRQVVGRGLGGSDEIAGYVMAGVAAWGLAYALTERAHVRIDVATARLPLPGRAGFDLLALVATSFVAGIVTFYAWRVLARTLERGSTANTPLETPLWIPQSVWVAGWVWLTVVAGLLTLCLVVLIAARRWSDGQAIAGTQTELDEVAAEGAAK
jgi:TRAP-type C4-dicarboxylate transport system permease small subunit